MAVGVSVLSASSAAADGFTWNGAALTGASQWSNSANWGGSAPSGSVSTLAFPPLGSNACTASPPTATCYQSDNDITGLNVNGLSLDDGVPYNITGNAITLGAGGITAAPAASDAFSPPFIDLPIALGTVQTWSLAGGTQGEQLDLFGAVTGGSSDALTVNFADPTLLGDFGGIEVGPVTATGPGTIAIEGDAKSLNGVDGNTVGLSGGAGLSAPQADAKVGPLSMSGGQVQVGDGFATPSQSDGTLAVDGAATFDATSSLMFFDDGAGITPGTDYSQLTATGAVDLGSANLVIADGQNDPNVNVCATLNPGDVDTLLTTPGLLTGTFNAIPNGTTIPLSFCTAGNSGTLPTVTIQYTPHSVTATVVTSGSAGVSTNTTLGASPASPVTNQQVTLTATVAASSGTPSGTVAFDNGGSLIAGCENQPVTFNLFDYTASCETSVTAASSPVALRATFIPSGGSGELGSTSSTDELVVGTDATTTALAVSTPTVAVGASVTYTATVTPAHAGATEPSGQVEFLDGGSPVSGCSAQPLTARPSSSSGTCTLSYPAAGSHSITAQYLADSNFTDSSSSAAQTVTVFQPPPLNASPPTISGTTTQGQTLTASNGTWSNSPTSYSYQWEDCNSSGASCSAISGATSQTYVLTTTDVGHTITVQESATNAGGTGGPANSAATAVVQAATAPASKPSNTSPPVISGTTTVGQTLSSSTGAWSGTAPITYSYQWARCTSSCSAIGEATGSSYTLTNADLGAKIAVIVTATNSVGSAQAVASDVGPVAAAGPSAAQVKAALSKLVKPSGEAAKLEAIVKAGGYKLTFTAPSAGKLVIDWYSKAKGKQVLVASASVVFRAAGKATVKLKLTGNGRKLLKAGKSVKITTKATLTPTGGAPTASTKTTTLKR